nr:MAG TPA: hypothetical protein [Crassvirales sp.]
MPVKVVHIFLSDHQKMTSMWGVSNYIDIYIY